MRRVIAAAVLASVPVLGAVRPAEARHAGGKASAVTGSASAHANWLWTGAGKVSDLTLIVNDHRCDNYAPYAKLRFTYTNGRSFTGEARYDKKGCNGGDTRFTNLAFSSNLTIQNVRIVLCLDKPFEPDPCVVGSPSSPNPHR